MAPRYVSADTPVEHVRVYVDGLQGQLRSRALRAAERINKRPPTLGKLDADLNAVADELGDEAIVEVTAGPRKGIICVTLRPEHGGHLTAGAGRGGRDVMLPGSALSFKLDGTPAAARGPPPLRVSAQGEWNLGQDGLGCCLTVAPLFGTGAWRLLPSVEMGAGLGGLFGLICPKSQHSYLQVPRFRIALEALLYCLSLPLWLIVISKARKIRLFASPNPGTQATQANLNRKLSEPD